ncbi:MAG: OadG family protein, partial [Gemmatimonadetes bacterium]|nr:OadG family protein [Gemmatimonadota bacterium]
MPWRRPADLLPRGTGSSREARATFDWESLRGGLLVTGAGMGVVFVVLFVLQLAIVALGAFDRAPAAAGVAPAAAPPAAPQAPAEDA